MDTFLFLGIGLLVGIALGWLLSSARKSNAPQTDVELARAVQAVAGKQEIIDRLEAQLKEHQRIEGEQNELLAKFVPLETEIRELKKRVEEKEEAQNDAFTTIKTQISTAQAAENELRNTTAALANALAKPGFKGSWGELTLERLLESLGMLPNVDWLRKEKLEADAEDVQQKRRFPDVVIRLPKDRFIAVDSKVPYTNYLAAMDAEDEVRDGDFSKRDALLVSYVNDIKTQIKLLAEKNYYNGLPASPEFTVLYMPNEQALSVALRVDPALMEHAFKAKIVLVTPPSFYTTMKTVAHIWSRSEDQKTVDAAVNVAVKFMQQSRLLLKEISELKSGLQSSVGAYNAMLKRLNKPFIEPVTKLTGFAALAQAGADMKTPTEVDAQLSDLTAIEFQSEADETPET